jgi:hypothetical protein
VAALKGVPNAGFVAALKGVPNAGVVGFAAGFAGVDAANGDVTDAGSWSRFYESVSDGTEPNLW